MAIELILNDRSERGVDPLAGRQVGRLMHRGANERMPKPHLRPVDLDQLGGDRGRQGIDTHPLAQHRFAGGKDFVERCPVVFRRHEQQNCALHSEDRTNDWRRRARAARSAEATAHLRAAAVRSPRGSSTRASGLPEASFRKRLRRSAERPGALASSKRSASASSSPERRSRRVEASPSELLEVVAHGHHENDRVRTQSARDEGQHVKGCLIQPLGIVGNKQHRLARRAFGQKRQRRERNQKDVGRSRVIVHAESGQQGRSLARDQALGPLSSAGASACSSAANGKWTSARTPVMLKTEKPRSLALCLAHRGAQIFRSRARR